MTDAQVVRFLVEHPDWSPCLRDQRDRVQLAGFFGPGGGFFSMEAIALAMAARSWWSRKGKPDV